MTSLEIRPVTAEEWPDYLRAQHIPFGIHITDAEMQVQSQRFGIHRTLAAFEDGAIVGTAGDWEMELTLPGRTRVAAPGVTAVGVLPTRRRRGILTSMMRRQLDDIRGRGEVVATLFAAESVIYGRFGYGWATTSMAAELDTARAEFALPVDGRVSLELVDKAEATKTLPAIFDQVRAREPGQVSRPEGFWDQLLRDPEWARDGDSELFHVIARQGEEAGFASYRVRGAWEHNIPGYTLRVVQLLASDSATRAALWRYCLDVDLVARVSFENIPVDDPVRWKLRDPRRLRATTIADWLWVRLVDVPRALEARRYRVEDRLVLEVRDPFLPENDGRYELDGSPDGARCRRSRAEADLALSVTELGAAYLGGTRLGALAEAGRVDELNPGALARADLMFGSDRSPWCATDF